MYKVLVQGAKIPAIAGKNQRVYFKYNKDHELDCQHASLQAEFDALVVSKVLEKIQTKPNKESVVLEKDKKEKVINQSI